MKKSYLLIIFLFITYSLLAQTQERRNKLADSLLTALDNHPQRDSMKTVILMKLADLYMRNNNKKAIEYYNRAIEAAQGGVRNKLFIASQHMGIGMIHSTIGEDDKAIEKYFTAIKILEERYPLKLGDLYICISNSFNHMGDYPKASSYLNYAEEIFAGKKDTIGLIEIVQSKSSIYDAMGKYDSAEIIVREGINLSRAAHDTWTEMGMFSNLGLMQKKTGKYDEAIANFKIALDICQREGFMIDMGEGAYNNLACGYLAAGKFATALPLFDSSIALAELHHNAKGLMENYRNLAELYGKTNNYKLQAIYLKKHYGIKDSLYTIDKNNQITQMEADYIVGKKSEEILTQQAAVAKEKNTRNLFILLGSFALLAAIGLLFFFFRTRKINKVITKQKNELQVLNDLKNRLFGIISHDLRNPLVTLRSYLTLSENPSLTPEKQTQIRNQTREMVAQTTDMLDNLLVWSASQIKSNTVQISHTDIEEVLQLTADMVALQAQQKNIALSIEAEEGAVALADKNLLSIVCRNLLTNAIKFTVAGGKVDIQTHRSNGHVRVSFADNGVGMSREQIAELMQNKAVSAAGTQQEKGTGLGIFLVKELVQKMNGELQIESTEGKGSKFIVVLDAA